MRRTTHFSTVASKRKFVPNNNDSGQPFVIKMLQRYYNCMFVSSIFHFSLMSSSFTFNRGVSFEKVEVYLRGFLLNSMSWLLLCYSSYLCVLFIFERIIVIWNCSVCLATPTKHNDAIIKMSTLRMYMYFKHTQPIHRNNS